MDRIPVYLAGYPRSGTTWLTRLLGDALDSPTGGCMPKEDRKELAAEGQDRPGPYIVRKGHYKLIEDSMGPVVPAPHRLAWRQLNGASVVFLARDPRDVCISGAHYWNTTPERFLNRMIGGRVAHLPAWHRYVDDWLRSRPMKVVRTTYERLSKEKETELARILAGLGITYAPSELEEVYRRQSFEARLNDYQGPHADQHKHLMRKGVVGDWREHFNRRMGHMCHIHFGATMARLGYIQDVDWWKELPL